jgi:ceramide glucosyltransferase
MGGVAALSHGFRRVCAVGKSMLLHRQTLERMGGLRRLSRYLAEDQVCGEETEALGMRAVVCHRPIDNVLGRLDFRQFCSRHLRWARIRRHISPSGYAAEVVLNPFGLAVVNMTIAPGVETVGFAVAVLTAMASNAWVAERSTKTARNPLRYVGLELARALTLLVLWPVPFFSNRVNWRGNRLRIGKRTLLTPHRHEVIPQDWEIDLGELAEWELEPRPETP